MTVLGSVWDEETALHFQSFHSRSRLFELGIQGIYVSVSFTNPVERHTHTHTDTRPSEIFPEYPFLT
ncbi:hypothetical protein BX666DRAFT_1931702 [Dichotomocladium elegans]|nr:hypothetical protein BX666DRAFT_1931702 [Dichotomocladium elegans]